MYRIDSVPSSANVQIAQLDMCFPKLMLRINRICSSLLPMALYTRSKSCCTNVTIVATAITCSSSSIPHHANHLRCAVAQTSSTKTAQPTSMTAAAGKPVRTRPNAGTKGWGRWASEAGANIDKATLIVTTTVGH